VLLPNRAVWLVDTVNTADPLLFTALLLPRTVTAPVTEFTLLKLIVPLNTTALKFTEMVPTMEILVLSYTDAALEYDSVNTAPLNALTLTT
jgi:hypothetical protein